MSTKSQNKITIFAIIGLATLVINTVILLQYPQQYSIPLLATTIICMILHKVKSTRNPPITDPDINLLNKTQENRENRQRQRHLMPKNLRTQNANSPQNPSAETLSPEHENQR